MLMPITERKYRWVGHAVTRALYQSARRVRILPREIFNCREKLFGTGSDTRPSYKNSVGLTMSADPPKSDRNFSRKNCESDSPSDRNLNQKNRGSGLHQNRLMNYENGLLTDTEQPIITKQKVEKETKKKKMNENITFKTF